MDLEISQHHAEREHYLVPIETAVKLWIQKRTEIGPVLDVKTFCYLD